MINIFIPNKTNFLILKKKNINALYIYNDINYLIIKTLGDNIFYNKNLKLIKFLKIEKNKIIENSINKFLFSWNNFFFKKITFNGKGFKLKKKKQNLIFFFNHSHLTLFIPINTYLKKIQKSKVMIFYKNYKNYNSFLKKIITIRKINIYTKRGLRFSRQLVYKRKGKGS
jgi:ribosomal protein L6P/L9E